MQASRGQACSGSQCQAPLNARTYEHDRRVRLPACTRGAARAPEQASHFENVSWRIVVQQLGTFQAGRVIIQRDRVNGSDLLPPGLRRSPLRLDGRRSCHPKRSRVREFYGGSLIVCFQRAPSSKYVKTLFLLLIKSEPRQRHQGWCIP